MKIKPLDVQGTAMLQASLRSHNQVLREEKGLWASLTLRSSDTSRVMNAQGNVKLALQDFLGTNPDAHTTDTVKAWLVDNARNPSELLERLNACY